MTTFEAYVYAWFFHWDSSLIYIFCHYIVNLMYDVQHLFHYQIIVSWVYIRISGHQSSDDSKQVLTHHDHLLSWLPPASVCAQSPPFNPRDCRVLPATPYGLFLPQFAIQGYEGWYSSESTWLSKDVSCVYRFGSGAQTMIESSL